MGAGSGVRQLTYHFSSFEGRVSRGVFWQACTLLVGAQFALTLALASTVGLGWRDFAFSDRRALWINLVVIAFFFWPSLALCVKRLHDRDLPGWWAGLLHVLLFIVYANQAAVRPLVHDKASLLIALVPVAMLLLVGVWLLVELAFLAGTAGPNRFGQPASADRGPRQAPAVLPAAAVSPAPVVPAEGIARQAGE